MKNYLNSLGFFKALQHLFLCSLLLILCNNTYAGAKTWTGATSTAWGVASNWNPAAVPTSKDDIRIPVTANTPVFSTGTITVHSLVVQSGATFTQTGGVLSVLGAKVEVVGTFNQTGGTLFTDHDFKIRNGGVLNQSGTALLHFAKNAITNPTAKINIENGGTVNQAGGTIYTKDYSASKGTFNQTGATALFKIFHDWKPGAGSNFNSTNGTVQFTGDAAGSDFTGGTRQFTNIIIDAGVDPKFGDKGNSKIPISGNFTNNNTTLNTKADATFILNGSSNQNIYSAVTGTANATFGNLVVNKPSGSALLTSNANIAGNMYILNGTYDLGTYTSNLVSGAGTLMVSVGATMRLAGNTAGQTGSNFPARLTPSLAKTSTVEYYGSGQTIYATPTYGNLTLSASGTKTATAGLNIAGNFNLSTATFAAGGYTHNVGGNWTMSSGTFSNTGSTVNFNGTGAQEISSTGAFNKMTINKATGTTTLQSDVTVNSTLTFTKGVLATGTNKVIIPSTGSISGAGQSTGWVNGNLQEYISTTAGGTFEVGDALYYTPVTETFNGAFTAGSVIVSVTDAVDPAVAGSSIAGKSISRYWNLSLPTTGALAFTKTDIALTWNAADNFTPVVSGSLTAAEYAGSAWSYPSVSGTPTSTTLTAKNITTLGRFTIGEITPCLLTSGFYYSAAEICSNSGAAAITLIGGATAGTFTASPAGLSINAITGTITTATSTPGTYTVTNTVVGSCTSVSSTSVKIVAAPVATISYGTTSYCQTAGMASVTLTGTTGGTFSSTYGLVIDDVTGEVDLNDSYPGTYTVTYTVNTVSGCSAFSTTALITVNVANYANIGYTEDAYCLNGGIAAVDFEGTTGGVFSSTAGLSLNTTTGAITFATSTAKAYTVTYSGAAANGCAAFSSTTTITITASSPGTIVYSGSPYCASGTASPTITGLEGGVFSSSAGLSIDEASGEIDLDSSTAGTYTVIYSFGGCYSTTNVTILAPAAISYANSPFCPNTGFGYVTLTGTTGGTFSSTSGLNIHASNGNINTNSSTSGNYTVYYSVPATATCPAYTVSTSIGIGTVATWTGAVSKAWELPANWVCGIVPSYITDVYIPAGLTNYPIISITAGETNSLILYSGSSITLNAGTLRIKGTITNINGSITATTGTMELTGTVAQVIPANLFTANTLKNLINSNPVSVTLAGAVRLTGTASFGNVNNSVLASNGYLTLVSTATYTANLADITNGNVNSGNQVTGDVTVERYVAGKRTYRFLTAPITSTTSIRTNWMENTNNPSTSVNNNPVPNYGTHISGASGSANYFDATSTNNPSLFSFNATNQSWSPAVNPLGLFTPGSAYRIMVRGSRSVDLNNNEATPSVTTLRAKGTLVTGPVTIAKAGGGGTPGTPTLSATTGAYNLIGNPYASVVDWKKITLTDVADMFYYYDHTVGGTGKRGMYVSYNGTFDVTSNPSSKVNRYIQSGQGIFVETTGPDPSIVFNETAKKDQNIGLFRTASQLPQLSVQLFLPYETDDQGAADGIRVFFSDDLDAAVSREDSYKFTNLDENLAIIRDGKALSIEGRKKITGSDSIPLKVWQLLQKSYSFKINLENFATNIEAYLEDKFLHTATPLAAGETLVPFNLTSDQASYATDRFRIVFESAASLPLTLTRVKAVEKNKGIQVEWTVESESNMDKYEVEKSVDAQNFKMIGFAKAKNNPGVSADYEVFDISPVQGDNYYRIRSVEKSGEIKYSEVIKARMSQTEGTVQIFPNPGDGKDIHLVITKNSKTNYSVILVNTAGQQVFTGNIVHDGGTTKHKLKMKGVLPAGMYQLQLSAAGKVENLAVSIQ